MKTCVIRHIGQNVPACFYGDFASVCSVLIRRNPSRRTRCVAGISESGTADDFAARVCHLIVISAKAPTTLQPLLRNVGHVLIFCAAWSKKLK